MRTNARLGGGSDGAEALAPLLEAALEAFHKGTSDRGGPLPAGGDPAVAERLSTAGPSLPETGIGAEQALHERVRAFTANAAEPADPRCAGHLHAPPLAVALAADLVASTANSSLDSWDQGPSGTVVERDVVRTTAGLVGFDPDSAAGALTSGGTESNLTALLLARDRAAAHRPRVFCSEQAHFSIARAAGILGIGEDAVVPVPVDEQHRMAPEGLRDALVRAQEAGGTPLAVVATAGTTDLGVVDPIPEIAALAGEFGAWVHVDAAYGGGALFSERLAPLLRGIERVESVGLDLHKLGWQPVATGMLLTRRAALFDPLDRRVSYLNTDDDEEAGFPGLVHRSLRTTRRADAFKVDVTFRALGRRGLGALVDRCHDLAGHAADRIAEHPQLRLLRRPELSTVVFRYVPEHGEADRCNARLRQRLLDEGRAVVGRTELDGRIHLKLTLLNPHATEADVDSVLTAVVEAGDKEAVAV
ncbi:aminotransferase class V-fold PLP-dependent enzyme [Salinifilum aidingensis]